MVANENQSYLALAVECGGSDWSAAVGYVLDFIRSRHAPIIALTMSATCVRKWHLVFISGILFFNSSLFNIPSVNVSGKVTDEEKAALSQ